MKFKLKKYIDTKKLKKNKALLKWIMFCEAVNSKTLFFM